MSKCSICGHEAKIQEFLDAYINEYGIGMWMNNMNQFQCPSCGAVLEIEKEREQ